MFIGVNSKARAVTGIYIGVNGKAREVTHGYIGVNGKARLFYTKDSGSSTNSTCTITYLRGTDLRSITIDFNNGDKWGDLSVNYLTKDSSSNEMYYFSQLLLDDSAPVLSTDTIKPNVTYYTEDAL